MLLATQALQHCVQPNEYDGIVKAAEGLKAKWVVSLSSVEQWLFTKEFI